LLNKLNSGFKNNSIKTNKYTWWNFLPMNLFYQFKKAPNLYFLLITFLQTIELISISGGKPAIALPLVIVVFISMLKDAYEDLKRFENDEKENYSKT